MQHREWLEERTAQGETLNVTLNPELEMIFGPGATRLALQYQGNGQVDAEEIGSELRDMEEETSDADKSFVTSTPRKQRARRKKRHRSEGRFSDESTSPTRGREPLSVSGFDLIALGSSFVTTASENSRDFMENESKKFKFDELKQHGEDEINVVRGEGGSLSKDDLSSGLRATMTTVGTSLQRKDWNNICGFWALQASLEEKVDSSEEEDFSEEEDESSVHVPPKSPDKDAEGENN